MEKAKDVAVQPIPKGYHAITPWIISKNSIKLIKFLESAFDAEETPYSRVYNEDGTVGHVEVKIHDSVVMLFDARKNWPSTPAFIRLYVENADQVFERAVKAGAKPVTEMTKLFFGDRVGRVRDPLGNIWWIQTHIEDIDFKDMEKRAKDPSMMQAMKYVQETLDREVSQSGHNN